MDNSPVYENFMNKMATMQSKPKINATTMKIGSNGLEKRVANNERKITAIKNIFKAQKIDIGEKIKPSNSPVEILTQTNETLVKIKEQLEFDFINSKKTEEDRLALEKKLLLKDQRDKIETDIETVKKNNKFVRETKKKILSPFQDIFSKLKQLALVLGSGLLINNLVNLMSKPEFVDGLKRVFDWTTKNWKLIAVAGAGLLALNIAGTAATLLKIAGVMKLIVLSPGFLAGLAFLAPSLFKGLPPTQKQLISDMIKMGGITEENRDKLIAEKQALIDKEMSKNFFLRNPGRIQALEKEIRFLETGEFGFGFKGKPSKKIDFEAIFKGALLKDAIIQDPKDFHDGGFNPSGVGRVHQGEFVLKKSAVDRIGLENLYRMNDGELGSVNIEQLEPIDLRSMKIAKKTSMQSATSVEPIDPINSINPYMSEVPILFGFNDLVYT